MEDAENEKLCARLTGTVATLLMNSTRNLTSSVVPCLSTTSRRWRKSFIFLEWSSGQNWWLLIAPRKVTGHHQYTCPWFASWALPLYCLIHQITKGWTLPTQRHMKCRCHHPHHCHQSQSSSSSSLVVIILIILVVGVVVITINSHHPPHHHCCHQS